MNYELKNYFLCWSIDEVITLFKFTEDDILTILSSENFRSNHSNGLRDFFELLIQNDSNLSDQVIEVSPYFIV